MPKYRKLWTKTTESLDIQDMPDDFTRLLWVLMPLALDRDGRGLDNPLWLKSHVFPLREDVTGKRITEAMSWYERRGMIRRYAVKGRRYFLIPTFAEYQGDTSRETDSVYPAPDDEELTTDSRLTPESVTTESRSDSSASANTDTSLSQRAQGAEDGAEREISPAAPEPERETGSAIPAQVIRACEELYGHRIYDKRLRVTVARALAEHGEPAVLRACRAALDHSARSFAYVERILANGDAPQDPAPRPKRRSTPPRDAPTVVWSSERERHERLDPASGRWEPVSKDANGQWQPVKEGDDGESS